MGQDSEHGTNRCDDLFFQTFPSGGPWCLQWINGPQSNGTDPFDPLVECFFVGIGPNCSGPRRATAAAGWLPLLIVGSFWYDGKMISRINTALKAQEATVTINKHTAHEFDGYHCFSRIGEKTYILPPKVYRLHSKGVKLVGVRVGDDPFGLIIPAMTLAQFYIGSSTPLAQALLNGAFLRAPETLCDLTRTKFDGPRVFRLAPRPGFSKDDFPALARFFAAKDGSPEREAYELPFAAAMTAAVERRPPSLCAAFPFHGTTTLTGEGITFEADLPDGTKTERILMLRLEHCTGPLPFDDLIIENEITTAPEDSDDNGRAWVHAIAGHVGPKQVVHERRSNRHYTTAEIEVPTIRPRFGALATLQIRVETIERPAETAPTVHIPGSVLLPDEVATGPLSSDKGNARRARVITRDGQPPPTRPEVGQFCKMLQELARRPGVADLSNLALPGERRTADGFAFGCVPSHPNGGWWHKITDKVARMLLAAEFTVNGRWITVIGVEPRPQKPKDWQGLMLVAHQDYDRIYEEDFDKVVKVIRRRRELWGERAHKSEDLDDLPKHLLFARITKTDATADELADSVLATTGSLRPDRSPTDAGEESRDRADASDCRSSSPPTAAT